MAVLVEFETWKVRALLENGVWDAPIPFDTVVQAADAQAGGAEGISGADPDKEIARAQNLIRFLGHGRIVEADGQPPAAPDLIY